MGAVVASFLKYAVEVGATTQAPVARPWSL
jgi:hypothetical protein